MSSYAVDIDIKVRVWVDVPGGYNDIAKTKALVKLGAMTINPQSHEVEVVNITDYGDDDGRP